MGYSCIYGIKGNLTNFTLCRCREKLLLDAGYAVSSKAILYTIIQPRFQAILMKKNTLVQGLDCWVEF